MIADCEILVAELLRRQGHLLDRVASVTGGAVYVEVAADVRHRDELREVRVGLELVAILAQLRRYPGQVKLLVDVLLAPAGDGLACGTAILPFVEHPVFVESPLPLDRHLPQAYRYLYGADWCVNDGYQPPYRPAGTARPKPGGISF